MIALISPILATFWLVNPQPGWEPVLILAVVLGWVSVAIVLWNRKSNGWWWVNPSILAIHLAGQLFNPVTFRLLGWRQFPNSDECYAWIIHTAFAVLFAWRTSRLKRLPVCLFGFVAGVWGGLLLVFAVVRWGSGALYFEYWWSPPTVLRFSAKVCLVAVLWTLQWRRLRRTLGSVANVSNGTYRGSGSFGA